MGEINTINFKYKITFIIPIYNTEKYLQRCVDSILEQTYNNIEIILVNDGSTDNSKQICEHYQQLDSRIKLINKPNGGLSDARNKGLDHSTGEYIIFIDSDDFWVDKYQLEKLLNVNSHGIDDFNMDIIGKSREELMELVKALFSSHNALSHFNGYWHDIEA